MAAVPLDDGADEYEVPLRDQRFFGAGIKRKRIHFVRSASTTENVIPIISRASTAAEKYLAIVSKKAGVAKAEVTPVLDSGEQSSDVVAIDEHICDICKRPITSESVTNSHSSSIAHQICLSHSHPPNHLDRTRKGLSVLESQGWDPDSRLGLGVTGEGRLYPVRATENPHKAGLGAKFAKPKPIEKPVRLDAGKIRLLEKEGKKKADALRNAFLRDETVEKYLGGGQTNDSLDLTAFRRAKRR
ncbi:hypothetical protein LTR62_007640 [Meristemomyces frigidus]|uniref:G-patch domain-containing protein n=1 Tax=Meristemomyces frigidus TaxID=1508187 RepID=A0AAN7TBX1_9PEZI|nr:hypothetical protein LTR62_007640 [Meristemomyces frigidus]